MGGVRGRMVIRLGVECVDVRMEINGSVLLGRGGCDGFFWGPVFLYELVGAASCWWGVLRTSSTLWGYCGCWLGGRICGFCLLWLRFVDVWGYTGYILFVVEVYSWRDVGFRWAWWFRCLNLVCVGRVVDFRCGLYGVVGFVGTVVVAGLCGVVCRGVLLG